MLHVWGCGRFGQHGKDTELNVPPEDSFVEELRDETVKLIGCGSSHTLVLTESKKLYGWGNSRSGQLGFKSAKTDDEKQSRPRLIETDRYTDIAGIACGCQHSFIWAGDGSCLRFGDNFVEERTQVDDGQTGAVKWVECVPKGRWILAGCVVKNVACGTRHALFSLQNGSVLGCGANSRHQLGTMDAKETNTPRQITSLPDNTTQVACGSFHSLCLTHDGDVYNWGYGPACGSEEDIAVPTKVDNDHFQTLIKISAGDSHSLALSKRGDIFMWGSNDKGQFGANAIDSPEDKPVNLTSMLGIGPSLDIAGRDDTAAAVLEDGSVLLWGSNIWNVLAGEARGNCYIRTPFHVRLNDNQSIGKVSIGAWHVAVIAVRSVTDDKLTTAEENNTVVSIVKALEDDVKVEIEPKEQVSKNTACVGNGRKKRSLWAAKKSRSFPVQKLPGKAGSLGLLVDVEGKAWTSEEEAAGTLRRENTANIGESVKPTILQRDRSELMTSNKGDDDFASESVTGENTVTFAPLILKKSHSMASFYIRRPKQSANDQQKTIRESEGQQRRSYAGMQRPCTNQLHSRHDYGDGLRGVYGYKKGYPTASERRRKNGAEAAGSRVLSAWNTEFLLDMTEMLHTNETNRENDNQKLSNIGPRDTDRSLFGSRKSVRKQIDLNAPSTSYSLQTLELSKLRGNESWKQNKFVRGLMKN